MLRSLPVLVGLVACGRPAVEDSDVRGGLLPWQPTLPPAYVVGQEVPPDFHLVVEAEDGALDGGSTIEADAGASGGSAVQLHGDGAIDLTIDVPVTGVYAIVVVGRSPEGFGRKFNHLAVDGERIATFQTRESTQYYAHDTEWAWMPAGVNLVSITSYWGWALYDRVEIVPVSPDYLDVSTEPVTPGASQEAQALLEYLVGQYGVATLAGQQGAEWIEPVREITGREPAVLAVDLIDYSPSRLFGNAPPADGQTEDALEWAERGGIVTVSWHWNAPTDLVDDTWVDENGNTVDASWYKGFYTYATTFDVAAALADPQSEDYALILRDIDAIAVQLQKLEDAHVPVLWRPLHEASGGWFWWGAKGPEAYLALWELLYDRLTDVHGLDNLIWVWNGQHEDWYPGDDTVDVVALDIYAQKRQYPMFVGAFGHAKNASDAPKLVALSESGTLPDPDWHEGAMVPWSWFNVWSGEDFVSNETWNEHDAMARIYAHERVLTLDELTGPRQRERWPGCHWRARPTRSRRACEP